MFGLNGSLALFEAVGPGVVVPRVTSRLPFEAAWKIEIFLLTCGIKLAVIYFEPNRVLFETNALTSFSANNMSWLPEQNGSVWSPLNGPIYFALCPPERGELFFSEP